MHSIPENLTSILIQIEQAAKKSHRSAEEIHLLAVSKTWDAQIVRLAASCGQRLFGENYVQEALEKIHLCQDLALEWHFIGPIQSNKSRQVAENFAWVHSVDSLKLAQRLSVQRPEHLPNLNICIQVNIADETTKHGVKLSEVVALAKTIKTLPRLNLRGLMCIPEADLKDDGLKERFRQMRQLKEELGQEGIILDTLSMGMSHDFMLAIEQGATIVRIGSAIFGERHYPK